MGDRGQISWKVQIRMQWRPVIRGLYSLSLYCSIPKFLVREAFIVVASRYNIKASRQMWLTAK